MGFSSFKGWVCESVGSTMEILGRFLDFSSTTSSSTTTTCVKGILYKFHSALLIQVSFGKSQTIDYNNNIIKTPAFSSCKPAQQHHHSY
jgi:hypothetical protein